MNLDAPGGKCVAIFLISHQRCSPKSSRDEMEWE